MRISSAIRNQCVLNILCRYLAQGLPLIESKIERVFSFNHWNCPFWSRLSKENIKYNLSSRTTELRTWSSIFNHFNLHRSTMEYIRDAEWLNNYNPSGYHSSVDVFTKQFLSISIKVKSKEILSVHFCVQHQSFLNDSSIPDKKKQLKFTEIYFEWHFLIWSKHACWKVKLHEFGDISLLAGSARRHVLQEESPVQILGETEFGSNTFCDIPNIHFTNI